MTTEHCTSRTMIADIVQRIAPMLNDRNLLLHPSDDATDDLNAAASLLNLTLHALADDDPDTACDFLLAAIDADSTVPPSTDDPTPWAIYTAARDYDTLFGN